MRHNAHIFELEIEALLAHGKAVQRANDDRNVLMISFHWVFKYINGSVPRKQTKTKTIILKISFAGVGKK